MTEQVDVKKLAEWAGIKPHETRNFFTGEIIDRESFPDFPNDLNACFDWIEPELYRRGYRYQLSRLQHGHMTHIIKSSTKGWVDIVAFAFDDEKPATAFCKAIEQMLDIEKAK